MRFTNGTLATLVAAFLLALAACASPRTAGDWLDDRVLAATAHCPPPPLVGEADTCEHLAWDFRK